MLIIENRASAIEKKKEGFKQGGILGFLDVVGGALGFGAACLVGSEFTFGLSCAGYFLLVGGGATGAVFGFDNYFEGRSDQLGLEESATRKYGDIP